MVKFPLGTFGQIESYRHIICIEIACRLLNVSFVPKIFPQAACVSETDYKRAVTVVKNALNVDWQKIPTIETLAIKFGTTYKSIAYDLLNKYQEQLRSAPGSIQDISKSAVHHAAAFYLTHRQRKVSLILFTNPFLYLSYLSMNYMYLISPFLQYYRLIWTEISS